MKMLRKSRRSIRLSDIDYSKPGAYFLTICTQRREFLFGEISNGRMHVDTYGDIIYECWAELPKHYANIQLDSFVVMPNHIHGIVVIIDDISVGAIHESPLPRNKIERRRMLIPKIVGRFKTNSAKRINQLRKTPEVRVWQRNYFEHIVRNEKALRRIREYIITNPDRWQYDKENPNFTGTDDFDSWIKSFSKPLP